MEELLARFILNLPLEELASDGRFGFQLEQAFWFYEDFYRFPENSPTPTALPKFSFKTFSSILLSYCPIEISIRGIGLPPTRTILSDEDVMRYIDAFYEYKSNIPTCGAIILNEKLNSCLLVRGWSSGSSWGFPKGKAAKDEHPHDCAAREVYEEISLDITPYIHNDQYLELNSNSQFLRLYIIKGIPNITNFPFQARTRKEIGDISWHSLTTIKFNKKNRYHKVHQFIRDLEIFIEKHGKKRKKDKKKVSSSTSSSLEKLLPEKLLPGKPLPDSTKEDILSERIMSCLMKIRIPTLDEMKARYRASSNL